MFPSQCLMPFGRSSGFPGVGRPRSPSPPRHGRARQERWAAPFLDRATPSGEDWVSNREVFCFMLILLLNISFEGGEIYIWPLLGFLPNLQPEREQPETEGELMNAADSGQATTCEQKPFEGEGAFFCGMAPRA